MERNTVERAVKTERDAKSRTKRSGQARLICVKRHTYTATSPQREGEPVGTPAKQGSYSSIRSSHKHHLSQFIILTSLILLCVVCFYTPVPAGSPSRGGDVKVYVYDMNQPSLPTPFYSVLVAIYVFMSLSTVFHSINSPGNPPLSHSVLLVLSLPCRSFQLYVCL